MYDTFSRINLINLEFNLITENKDCIVEQIYRMAEKKQKSEN